MGRFGNGPQIPVTGQAGAPLLREAYVDLASLLYAQENWEGVLYFTGCALDIRERPATYICEAAAWGSLPWDLRSIALYHTGQISKALEAAEQALTYAPENERIQQNVSFFKQSLSEARTE